MNQTLKEMQKLVGRTVVFTKAVEDQETGFEAGMKARITAVYEDDNTFIFKMNFSDFEEFNKGLMQPTYYDKHRNPTLKWCDSPYYPEDRQEDVWMAIDTKNPVFEVLQETYTAAELGLAVKEVLGETKLDDYAATRQAILIAFAKGLPPNRTTHILQQAANDIVSTGAVKVSGP